MKKTPLALGLVCLSFVLCSALAWAQCPEDPIDNGVCDTMYVEVYECDSLFAGEERQVRVPIRITNDIPTPATDSIAGFVIPLCFTTSNSSAQCVLETNHNLVGMNPPFVGCYPWDNPDGSIFRHLPNFDDWQEHNWMMDLCTQFLGLEWDTHVLDLSQGNSFWLSLVSTGTQDQRFCGGSRVLLATMTFTVDDTMTICLDSCFWPPTGQLLFSRGDGVTYVPRHNLPYCFSVSYPGVGDCNADGIVDIGDVVYLIGYLYRGGAPPPATAVGDANCDGIVDIGDVVRLIGYLFKGEPPPSC
jgi:hypothetical protein